MSTGTIVTFYSYKGGVGRTLTLANVAALLSLWGYKVLCVDWDLEAPGLHLYFKKWIENENSPGLTEFIQAYADGEQPQWQNFSTTVNFPNAKAPLHFVPAGLRDESYIKRMQDLDWEALYETHNIGNFLEDLRSDWKQNFDFIFLDSRTGVTDIGGICTVHLPDLICLLFTANEQSLYGAVDVVERASQARSHLPFDRDRLWVLPVATRFESRIEYELAQEWLSIFSEVLTPLFDEWVHKDVMPLDILNFIKVPYVPYWSFGEKIPVIEEGTKDPESIGFAFESITSLISLKLGSSDVLIKNRDAFVSAARLSSPTKKISSLHSLDQPIQVFIIYSCQDEVLRDELSKHLRVLQRQGISFTWYGREIRAGIEWDNAIDANINTAQIILILISPDLLASEYFWDAEIQAALDRHEVGEASVIPIILRPADWQSSRFSTLQAFPRDGTPITMWDNRDAAFVDVIQGIRKAALDISEKSQNRQIQYS